MWMLLLPPLLSNKKVQSEIREIIFYFFLRLFSVFKKKTSKKTKHIPAGSIPGPAERFTRVWSHMVRVVQSLRFLCRQGGEHPPAAQKASAVHILLTPFWLGGARNRWGPAVPYQGRLQSADDEAVRLCACVGHVRGQRGWELHTLGGLSGELRVLHGEIGWYPQVDVSQKVLVHHLFLLNLYLYLCVITLVLCCCSHFADPPKDFTTLTEVWNSHTLDMSSFSAADKWLLKVKWTCLATFSIFYFDTLNQKRTHGDISAALLATAVK